MIKYVLTILDIIKHLINVLTLLDITKDYILSTQFRFVVVLKKNSQTTDVLTKFEEHRREMMIIALTPDVADATEIE